MTDVQALHRRACEGFAVAVAAVRPEQWDGPTPCAEWSVRDLVNHVVAEDLWTAPLLGGATIADVGDRFDGDVLGDDPAAASDAASREALTAAGEPGALARTVHLSLGDTPGEEYVWQLFADHLIHRWDLARATGQADELESDLVAACAGWFAEREDAYRAAGAIGPRAAPGDDDPQARLLAAFGRTLDWTPERAVVDRFNAAFDRRGVDAIMALMTDDCVFEDTTPPDGRRHEGQAAVRAAWKTLFSTTREPRLEIEEVLVAGDRAVQSWTYRWAADAGAPDHVRGVDVLRLRGGLIAEKRSYVKG